MADPKEIRCPSRILGKLTSEGHLEIKCPSRACGAGNGVVVFHYIDLRINEVVKTMKFQDPQYMFNKKEEG